ncbi:GrpB family protein [Serratia marcescens]|nr:GrpB family protein [Serratia marcescens]MBH2866200.1 GrpB family protein [Serratia marcescens]
MNKVIVSDYDNRWGNQFLEEADRIKSAVKFTVIFIDHVGSTSVEGLSSKPIIDILISLCDWSAIDNVVNELKKLGYSVSEECEQVPRCFLKKYNSDNSGNYHVHICEPHRSWGRDMLIFKNELTADKELLKNYSDLKIKLAKLHSDDIESYMSGKKTLIENRLREVKNEFGVDRLLSYQRSESDKAEKLQIWMMACQFLIATVAAFSVYFDNNTTLFSLAIFGFLLMLGWFYLNQGQQRHRSAGDQARRVVLLISGLNAIPSAGQNLRINDKFNVTITKKTLRREEEHFSTREAPGYKRLVEMIEESSYWSCYLQKFSAKMMSIVLFILVAIIFIVSVAAVTSLDSNNLISLSRVMIALMVFVVSSDSLGLLLAYKNASTSVEEVFNRVEAISAKGYLKSDALLLMTDYNSAIEKAPAILPYAYKLSQEKLNKKWKAYSEGKLNNT